MYEKYVNSKGKFLVGNKLDLIEKEQVTFDMAN